MLNVGSVSWNWSRNYTKWDIKHVRARNQRLPPPPARKIERNEWKTPAPACVSTTHVRVCVCIYSGRSPGRKKRLLWCGKNARAIALARGANRAQSGGNVATQGDHLRRDAQQRKLQQFRHIPSGSKRYLLEFYLKRTHTHTHTNIKFETCWWYCNFEAIRLYLYYKEYLQSKPFVGHMQTLTHLLSINKTLKRIET